MKMISTTRRQNSLSLSGGCIVSDSLSIPSYSPNAPVAQSFPWEDQVDDINTPDIDPSFFDSAPFFKKSEFKSQKSMDPMEVLTDADNLILISMAEQTSFTTAEDTDQQSINSYEENFDLSSLINQTTAENTETQSMVAPNDVLEFLPSTTAQLHYLEPRPVESIASTVNTDIIFNTSLIDSLTSQSTVESFSQFTSPAQTSSYSLPSLSQSYASPSASPALSFTSNTSQSTLVSAMDGITSDTNTIDSVIETKPDVDFLQPTVINEHINDHGYSIQAQSSSKRRKASNDKTSPRLKNNVASKKSRVTKKSKQDQMEKQIQHYIEDNARCTKMIADMEKQIQWCKDYLFKKVAPMAQRS